MREIPASKEITEKIITLLKIGNLAPKSILAVLTDWGYQKKDIQICMQILLDNGTASLSREMDIQLTLDKD